MTYRDTTMLMELLIAFHHSHDKRGEGYLYVNRLHIPNGAQHIYRTLFNAAARALTSIMDEISKSKSSLAVKSTEIKRYMSFVMSIYQHNVQFQGQAKDSIASKLTVEEGNEIYTAIYNWFQSHLDVAKKLATAIKSRRSSEKELVNKAARNKLNNTKNAPTKLVQCTNKVNNELMITEGDSAAGTLSKVRNGKTTAYLPLKGKPLNVLKTKKDPVLNDEIASIIQALGTGIGRSFDLKKLRYDSIIILTDADSDGKSIANLLIAMFHTLTPGLIEDKRVFICDTPTHRMVYKGGKELFPFSTEEYEENIKKYGPPIDTEYYKGLGSLPPEVYEEYICGKKRRLRLVTIEDADTSSQVIDDIIGSTDTTARKEFFTKGVYIVNDFEYKL